MTAPVQISTLGRVEGGQLLAVSALLAESFQFDPMHEWLFPSPSHRTRQLRRFFELDIRHRLNESAQAHLAGHLGVAFWHPPGHWSPQRRSQARLAPALASVLLRHPVSAPRIAHEVLRVHPAEPHWYLSHLAVTPSARGRGIGRSLLAVGIAHADDDGIGCYLETSDPINLAFYRASGFAQIGIVNVGGTPQVWRLWRAPR